MNRNVCGRGVVLSVCGAIMSSVALCQAEEAKLAGSLDLPVLSSYVWRGQVLNDEPVGQPSVTLSKNGFALNFWANVNLTDKTTEDVPECTEIDIAPSYTRRVGAVSVAGGVQEYLFPHQTVLLEDGTNTVAAPGTREVYMSASLPDLAVVPSVSVYYDFDEIDGVYAVVSLAYAKSFASEKVGLAVNAALGFGLADYNKGYFGVDQDAMNDASVSASLSMAVSQFLSISPGIQYSWLPDRTIRNAAEERYLDSEQLVGSVKVGYTF